MKNLFSIPFLILPIDTSVECELYSNLNFVHFFLGNILAFFLSGNILLLLFLANHLVLYI